MRYILFALVFFIGGLGWNIGAQNDAPRTVTADEVNAIAQELYCPVCENITLDTCGTAACADWRYEIQLQLEAGFTSEQIKADFVRRFGDRVVGTPQDPLLRVLSLVTPFVLVAAGLILLLKWYWGEKRAPQRHILDTLPPVAEPSDADLRARIERDSQR